MARMTVGEAAEQWGVTVSAVHKMVREQRVKHERAGGGPRRAGMIFILQDNPPAKREVLTDEEREARRAAWPRASKASNAKRMRRKRAAQRRADSAR